MPLKRPPGYEETPYAEITQFFRGPVEPEKEEDPKEKAVNQEGPLEEPNDDMQENVLNNLGDDAHHHPNEQASAATLYPKLEEVDSGKKTEQFVVSI